MNKKILYLHIGMGKTGTTALQRFFDSNREVLKQYDIYYPLNGTVSGAHHLLAPDLPGYLANIWNTIPVDSWAPEIIESEQNNILISSELIAWSAPDKAKAFCEAIGKWFEPKVILYLRRQDNLIMASYNQNIKAGYQKRDISTFLRNQLAKFDYWTIISPWEESLGKSNILIRPYEREQFYKRDIYHDFMHRFFAIDIDSQFSIENDDANPRLEAQAMEFKRLVNNIVENNELSEKLNEILMRYTPENPSSPQKKASSTAILSPAERTRILQKWEATNARIAEKYLGRKDCKLFYEPYPSCDEDWQPLDLSDEYTAKLIGHISDQNAELSEHLMSALEKALCAADKERQEAAKKLMRKVSF